MGRETWKLIFSSLLKSIEVDPVEQRLPGASYHESLTAVATLRCLLGWGRGWEMGTDNPKLQVRATKIKSDYAVT